MNVLWQDNVPSFLDASGLGAGSFAGSLGDGGAPWFASADGGLFSGQPVLWWDNGADSAAADSGLAGFDPGGAAGGWLTHGAEAFAGTNPALDGGLLWPDDRDSTSNLVLTGAGMGQWDLSAGNGVSSQWPQSLNEFASTSSAWLTEASNLLWTGGTDQAAFALPAVDNAPLANPTSLGNVGVPPFSMLAPQQLVWTDQSRAPTLISEPGVVDPASITFPRTLGVPVQSPSGLLPRLGGTP
jgi:hypothetical protein